MSQRGHYRRIGDLALPRGEYTLWLLPREDGGELIVSEGTRQWGLAGYSAEWQMLWP